MAEEFEIIGKVENVTTIAVGPAFAKSSAFEKRLAEDAGGN